MTPSQSFLGFAILCFTGLIALKHGMQAGLAFGGFACVAASFWTARR